MGIQRTYWLVGRLVITAILLVVSVLPAKALGFPSLTYIRFNRYGDVINATYCIAADSYTLGWGEDAPNYWFMERSYGAINGCTTKRLYTNVVGNETLSIEIWARANNGSFGRYSFQVIASGPTDLSNCWITFLNSQLSRDPRLNSNTACAFWDQ